MRKRLKESRQFRGFLRKLGHGTPEKYFQIRERVLAKRTGNVMRAALWAPGEHPLGCSLQLPASRHSSHSSAVQANIFLYPPPSFPGSLEEPSLFLSESRDLTTTCSPWGNSDTWPSQPFDPGQSMLGPSLFYDLSKDLLTTSYSTGLYAQWFAHIVSLSLQTTLQGSHSEGEVPGFELRSAFSRDHSKKRNLGYHWACPLCFHGKPRCPESTTTFSVFPHAPGEDAYLWGPQRRKPDFHPHCGSSRSVCFPAHVDGALRYLHRLPSFSQGPSLGGKVLSPHFTEEKTKAHRGEIICPGLLAGGCKSQGNGKISQASVSWHDTAPLWPRELHCPSD